jgi:antitoxin CcdA
MRMNYISPRSRKTPLNVSIDAKLLSSAREKEINLSALLDKSLRRELAERWQRDNAEAIRLNNKRIEEEGLWCDEFRTW